MRNTERKLWVGVVGLVLAVTITATAHAGIAPVCLDDVKNGTETDVDCGGSVCPPCGVGKSCNTASDCQTDICDPVTRKCLAPTPTNTPTITATATVTATPTASQTATPTVTPHGLPNGAGCTDPLSCASTFCVTSVCCDTACTDPLMRCDQPGKSGTCASPVAPAPALAPSGLLVGSLLLVSVGSLALRRRADRH
jgi:hypothetical protein